MKAKSLICLLLIVFMCVSIQAVSAESNDWLSKENEYFVVKYHPGYEADADVTLETALLVRNITLEKYPHSLPFKVVIHIYTGTEELGRNAVIYAGSSSATIHILKPSWTGSWGGFEKLGDPFRRILNHEYVHAPVYYDLYSKPYGYKDSAGWFSQGLAEYISGNFLSSYEKNVREAVQGGDFTVDEPYSWGITSWSLCTKPLDSKR
ncbi:MAG: hypothetical protein NWF00_12725 [Candidatus Bathyarchaeota archaeon]|nr:hypothetical protein [Candidatus Bathyarchaeota archaeon]